MTFLIIVGAIVFAESGLLIGFFLPGDTLLFSVGFFAAQGHIPLAAALAVIFFAAVVGDNVGYTIGRKLGPKLFTKKNGLVFRQEYVQRAEAFYEKHGGKTIILARFVPVVRTFAPMVAGVGKMPRKRFVLYNVVGGAIWTGGVVMLGFFLGQLVDPHVVEKFILLALGFAMLITFGPTIWHLLREKRLRDFIARRFKAFSRNKQDL
ncbi:MAG: DedA family protein [Candidatus Saccharimonadales bacterium]